MKRILSLTALAVFAAYIIVFSLYNGNPFTKNENQPVATQGRLGEANIACVEHDGILVSRRGGGVICKLPNGEIVDQMTLLD